MFYPGALGGSAAEGHFKATKAHRKRDRRVAADNTGEVWRKSDPKASKRRTVMPPQGSPQNVKAKAKDLHLVPYTHTTARVLPHFLVSVRGTRFSAGAAPAASLQPPGARGRNP